MITNVSTEMKALIKKRIVREGILIVYITQKPKYPFLSIRPNPAT